MHYNLSIKIRGLVPFFLFCIAVIVYWPAVGFHFFSDDFATLGIMITEGRFSASFNYFYRPVTLASLWLSAQLYGVHGAGYHLENILIHGMVVVTLYYFVVALGRYYQEEKVSVRLIAFMAAAFYAVLPSHSEAVIWIVARADLFSALFVLLSLLCYLNWLQERKVIWFFSFIISLFLALGSKENAFCLPLLLVVLTLFHAGVTKASLFSRFYIYSGVLAATFFLVYLMFRHAAIKKVIGGYDEEMASLEVYFNNFAVYVFRSFFASFYSSGLYNFGFSLGSGFVCLMIFLMAYVFDVLKNKNVYLLLWVFYLISVLPVLHRSIGVGMLAEERYLYLPTVFTCVLLAMFIAWLINSKRLVGLFSLVFVVLFFINDLRRQIDLWAEADNFIRATSEKMAVQIDDDQKEPLLVIGLPVLLNGVQAFNQGFSQMSGHFLNKLIGWDRQFYVAPLFIYGDFDGYNIDYVEGRLELELRKPSGDFWSKDEYKNVIASIEQGKPQRVSIGFEGSDSYKDYKVIVYCGDSMRLLSECEKMH